jgi:hypothetical protein
MRHACWLLLVVVGSCRIGGVETLPISGDAPSVIAVWPLAVGGDPPQADVWFAGLSQALARRGYRVLPPGVTRELLAGSELAKNAPGSSVGRVLRADAVLRLEIREFEADGRAAVQHAQWDIVWHLVSTRGYGEQWSFRHHGTYSQAARASFDPGRSFDEQHTPPDIVPIGGLGPRGFRSPADLLASLHNQAMERLPKL